MEIAGSQTDELMTELSEWPGWSACPNAPANLPCLIMDPGRPADVAVIGDSHAQHFSFGLREHYKSRGLNVMASTRSACLPFFEAVVNRPGYQCEGAIDKALNEAMHSSTVKTIILAGYANWRIQGNRGNGDPNGYRNNPSAQELQRNSEAFREALHETLARLTTSGKNIVYLVDNPELYFDVRACMIERPIKLPGANGQEPCFVSRQQFDERNQIYHQIIEVERSEFPDIKFVDTWKVLCDLDKCHGTVNGVILFHDRDHLNMAGSQYVIERVTDQLP
jgi:hypothetical protein